MQIQHSTRIHLGMLGLPISGVLYAVSILLRGPFIDPTTDPTSFAQLASTYNFGPAWLGIMAGFVLELFGILALYGYLAHNPVDRSAFWGMVLSLVGIALALPLVGAALAWPSVGRLYLAGQKDVIEIAAASFSGDSARTLYLSGIFFLVGTIFFAVAVWQSGTLPKWSAIPYVVQAPLLAFPISFATELFGAVLLVIAGSWIARSVWQYPSVNEAPKIAAASNHS